MYIVAICVAFADDKQESSSSNIKEVVLSKKKAVKKTIKTQPPRSLTQTEYDDIFDGVINAVDNVGKVGMKEVCVNLLSNASILSSSSFYVCRLIMSEHFTDLCNLHKSLPCHIKAQSLFTIGT